MYKTLLISMLLVFFPLSANAGSFMIPMKKFFDTNPASQHTVGNEDCAEKSLIYRCCEDATGASCNDQPVEPCLVNGDCTDENPPYDTCAVMDDSTINAGDQLQTNYDFTTADGYGTKKSVLADDACTYMAIHEVPDDIDTTTYALNCAYGYNTNATTGITAWEFAAVAVNDATSSAVSTEAYVLSTDDVALPATAVANMRQISTFTTDITIDNGDDGLPCSGNTCLNKVLKLFFRENTTSQTATGRTKLRYVVCKHN